VTSVGEEHNPYAAPQAELQLRGAVSRPGAFYAMSPRKAAVLSVLTFNLFDIVFWYRHWKRLQETGHDVSPIWRAIFAAITSFSFVTTLSTERAARGLQSDFEFVSPLRATPGIYLGLNLVSRVAERVLEGVPHLAATLLACTGCAWVLATVQRGANEVLEADAHGGPSNSGATVVSIIVGALGLLSWLLVILAAVSPESLGLDK
jgi:hypothetical protein